MVCANPDLVVMHGGRAALCAGAIAEQYETDGRQVRWHGKPYRSVYDSVFDLLGVADRGRSWRSATVCAPISPGPTPGIPSLFIGGSGIHGAEFMTDGKLDLGRIEAAIREAGVNPIGVAARFVLV